MSQPGSRPKPSDTIVTQGRLFAQADNTMTTYNVTAVCEDDACRFTNIQEDAQCSEAIDKVGLFCRSRNESYMCTNGDVRLMGGNSASEGRVEICLNNQWGTICDDSWDAQGATVLCRQLGYTFEGWLDLNTQFTNNNICYIFFMSYFRRSGWR